MATAAAAARQTSRRFFRRRDRIGKAPGSLPPLLMLLMLLSSTILGIIIAPVPSSALAADTSEESTPTPPPRLPFPSVAEAVGSAAAAAIIYARTELSERQLKHTSGENWLPRAVVTLRARGRVGDVVSVRVMPPRIEERKEEDGGEIATSVVVVERFLVAHRGHGRCCNAWCVPKGTSPEAARRWGVWKCSGAAIKEAPVLLLASRRRTRGEQQQKQKQLQSKKKNKKNDKAGSGEPADDFVVEREFLAGRLFLPHSVTLGPAPRGGEGNAPEVFYVVDHLLDQVLTVSLSTGEEVGPRLGTPWSLDALRRGADLDAFPGLHRAFYSHAVAEEAEKHPGRGGASRVLVEPTAAAGTSDGRRVFVGSGYLDSRVVAFDPSTGEVVAQVARGPAASLAAMADEVASGRPGAPVDVHIPYGQVEGLIEALRSGRKRRERDGGDGEDPDDAVVAALSRAVARGTAASNKKRGRKGGVAGSGPYGPGVPLSAVVAALRESKNPETRALADDPVAPGSLGWRLEGQRGPALSTATTSVSSSAVSSSSSSPPSWPWQNPHSLAVDDDRRVLYVANRERASVDALDLDSLELKCTYSLVGLGGGGGGSGSGEGRLASEQAFTVVRSRPSGARLFVHLVSGTPMGSAVVELSPRDCGAVLAVYPTPYGLFPMHDLDVVEDSDGLGGLSFVVATRTPETYYLPPPVSSSSDSASNSSSRFSNGEQVRLLLALQWGSMLFLALLLPVGWFAARALGLAADAAYELCGCAARRSRKKGGRGGGGGEWAPVSNGGGGEDEDDRRPLRAGGGERSQSGLSFSSSAATAEAAAPLRSTSSFRARGEVEMQALTLNPLQPPERLKQPRAAAGLPKSPFESTATATPAVTTITPGRVFFVRHGESTSNERGILAGIIDVGLTRFGTLQAARAGADVARLGVKFDVVITSNLRRTAYTAKAALEACGQSHLRMRTDSRIAERSFGIFAGQSIRLLQMGLGE